MSFNAWRHRGLIRSPKKIEACIGKALGFLGGSVVCIADAIRDVERRKLAGGCEE